MGEGEQGSYDEFALRTGAASFPQGAQGNPQGPQKKYFPCYRLGLKGNSADDAGLSQGLVRPDGSFRGRWRATCRTCPFSVS